MTEETKRPSDLVEDYLKTSEGPKAPKAPGGFGQVSEMSHLARSVMVSNPGLDIEDIELLEREDSEKLKALLYLSRILGDIEVGNQAALARAFLGFLERYCGARASAVALFSDGELTVLSARRDGEESSQTESVKALLRESAQTNRILTHEVEGGLGPVPCIAVPLKCAGQVAGSFYLERGGGMSSFESDLEQRFFKAISQDFGRHYAEATLARRLHDEKERAEANLAEERSQAAVLRRQNEKLTAEMEEIIKKNLFGRFTSHDPGSIDPVVRPMYTLAKRAATSDIKVLILGESGTGKTELARQIARLPIPENKRSDKPFEVFNVVETAAELFESKLFGHVKGAFTGAISHQAGVFELANGGTIFIDEIGDLPLRLQSKLLRIIERGVGRRMGPSTKDYKVDVRVICATNRDLRKMVKNDEFREDLYHRVANGLVINIPPLRERGDRGALIRHLFELNKTNIGMSDLELDDEAYRWLVSYDWPGNIRELEQYMEGLVLRSDGQLITRTDLQDKVSQVEEERKQRIGGGGGPNLDLTETGNRFRKALHRHERALIREAAEAARGDVPEMAEILGVNRSWLYQRMTRLEMSLEELREDAITASKQRRSRGKKKR